MLCLYRLLWALTPARRLARWAMSFSKCSQISGLITATRARRVTVIDARGDGPASQPCVATALSAWSASFAAENPA